MPARINDQDDEPDSSSGNNQRNNDSPSFFPQPDYTNTRSTSQQKSVNTSEIEKIIAEYNIKKQEESWIRTYWRPAMGWLYMVICAFDFILFPLMTMFLPVLGKMIGFNIAYSPWVSLTLSNGGLIHMAFGAILGVAAWTRGQEKLHSMSNR